jgi:protocatechuate 3,4-dioxygenase alpha subunit
MTLPATPSQTVGPYYSIALARRVENALVPPSAPGSVRLRGRLLDGAGDPIDGMVELWDHRSRRWARCGTDDDGWFEFTVAKPPGGDGDGEAPRLDVYVFARGLLKHQLTRMYFPNEAAANGADPVLAQFGDEERAVLVAREEDGGLRFDIRMQGDDAAVFFAV